MAEFLDGFGVEREHLLEAVAHFETVWGRFQERRSLDVEGSERSDSLIAGELDLLKRDLLDSRFTVGIFGLIKRGKSTLLNALIGREVSSMHVTPETAVPVYVEHADQPGAAVHFADGSVRHVAVEDVHEFTSQKSNPNNARGVTHVEQAVPVGFLRNGVRLIDTPGLDDAEADEVYTERTMQELDVVDAGIVVFLSPPTVGRTELAFLEDVASRDLTKTFLVCNMYPQHFNDPETRNAVLQYVGERIVAASRKLGRRGPVRIYPVCALEAWQARLTDDIDAWKRSGADRLLRDVESYLAEQAGSELLQAAAQRIAKAAEMAKADVYVRQQLLEDPQKLSHLRTSVDESIRDLEARFHEAVNSALHEVGPLRMRIRGRLLRPFEKARRQVRDAADVDELDAFARRFRRELEVAGEQASRDFSQGFGLVVEHVRTTLEERFNAVMTDLAPNVPTLRLSSGSALLTPDQFQELLRGQATARRTATVSGVVTGVAGGGAVALATGMLVLGPIGLLGGALAGWKLSDIAKGGSVTKVRDAMLERLDEISRALLADFDEQVERSVETLRTAVTRRRKAFAADLYQQFDLVEGLAHDAGVIDAYRRDAQRFIMAFDACVSRARRAVQAA